MKAKMIFLFFVSILYSNIPKPEFIINPKLVDYNFFYPEKVKDDSVNYFYSSWTESPRKKVGKYYIFSISSAIFGTVITDTLNKNQLIITLKYFFKEDGYYYFLLDGKKKYITKMKILPKTDICVLEIGGEDKKIIIKKQEESLKITDYTPMFFKDSSEVKQVSYVDDNEIGNEEAFNLIGIAKKNKDPKFYGFLIEDSSKKDLGKCFIGEGGEIYIISKQGLEVKINGISKKVILCFEINF